MRKALLPLAASVSILISGCNDDNTNNSQLDATNATVVSTNASDYTSGAHAIINRDDHQDVALSQVPTVSDLTLVTHGEYIYRIERFGADNVTKFHIDSPSTAQWQYSTLDTSDNSSGNPHDLVFIDESTAVLLRYGKATAWVVDPSSTIEANFKTAELDLTAYDDGDGAPEASRGLIVDGKLFIIMQRQTRNPHPAPWAPGQAYVAVFDTTTMTEIDTGHAGDSLNGIPLTIQNPRNIIHNEITGLIYVQGLSYSANTYTGGIETINPTSYANNLLVDDNSILNGGIDKISSVAVLSADKGYLVSYEGWGDNSLYSFNPTTGVVDSTAIDQSLAHIAIDDIAIDGNGQLWISNQTLIGMTVIDTADDSVVESIINTDLNPGRISFISK